MNTIATAVLEGPYGNPETRISAPSILDLRKNEKIEEARRICQEILDGREMIHVAKNSSDLVSYGVGSMIAKLHTKNAIANIENVFSHLLDVFPYRAMCGEKAYRFNRRTLFDTLVHGGLIAENCPMRDAKPAGTLPTVSEIARIVANYSGITLEQIQSAARSRDVVDARFITIWVMRTACGHSLTYIGEQLGNRDHTSILNGVSRIRKIRATDPGKKNTIDNICDESDLLALRRHYKILTSQSGLRRIS
jgi:hypothetical protein